MVQLHWKIASNNPCYRLVDAENGNQELALCACSRYLIYYDPISIEIN